MIDIETKKSIPLATLAEASQFAELEQADVEWALEEGASVSRRWITSPAEVAAHLAAGAAAGRRRARQ